MTSATLEQLITMVSYYLSTEEVETIKQAYEFAESMHKGQTRQSGEDYIVHPTTVACILAEMHADTNTICAALLHDTLEDTKTTKEDIAHYFNQDVANLVDGVTKLAKMNFSSKQEQNAANTRKIITGIRQDVRIIIIKLADRLHNMRTLQFKSESKQQENALETLEIFAPLAYYIGAYRIKSELEDLSLKYLLPSKYKTLEEKKKSIEDESDAMLKEMLAKIHGLLSDKNIPNEIKVRTKNIYGIYKRLNEGQKLSDIHDLLALKIMVDEVDNCYRALGVIHKEYHPLNSRFKDYICNPKTNMYTSLHTTVFGPNDKLVQTQIRTFDMDKIASFGLTAYWDLLKGDARRVMQEDLASKSQFFTSLVELDSMFKDNEEFVTQVKNELFGKKVYVYATNGEKIELPEGSTIIDLAYKLGPDVGNTMIGAKVNDEVVTVDHVLKTDDRVVIMTDTFSFGPRKDWEGKAYTSLAKRKIREFYKERIAI